MIPNNIKEKLLSYQIPHTENLIYSLKTYNRALDSSDTGCGKTYTAIAAAITLGLKPLIICPKSVLTGWQKVLTGFDSTYYGLSNYESIQNCKMLTAASKNNKVKCQWIKRVELKDNLINFDVNLGINKKSEKKEVEYTYVWDNLPKDILIIFDEAHRCKNAKTLNHSLLNTAARTSAKILMLSATVADKPENFALAGFVLGLYKSVREANNWISSAGANCKNIMQGVHKELVPEYMSRMRIKDLGDLFPENQILAECYDMDMAEEIEKQYKIIEDEVNRLKNKEESSGYVLAKILYARMRIEQLRIPTFVEMAEKYLEEGCAVAIFVNFTSTLKTLAEQLKTNCVIHGEQSLVERDKNINDFNKDKSHVIIANIRSGGCGISLHDLNGDYPRVSIISPSWSAQDIIQALGRIHRANGKTKVRQRIVFCKGTIEEKVCEGMKEKIKNISSLNDGKLDSIKIEGLMDESVGVDKLAELSEFDITFQRINVLNAKRDRLKREIKETEDELKSLETALNTLVI
jgi:SNF2 family DNA or RNA helicase